MTRPIVVGMDVGSTTAKAVVVDPETKKILWSDYKRHHTKQPEAVLEFMVRIGQEFIDVPREQVRMFITGSGGGPLAEPLGAKFVQEVNAVTLAVDSGTFRISTSDDVQETVIETVEPVDGVEASHFVRAGQEVSDGEWIVAFYPDGTCDGAAFQFDEGTESRTVQIRKRDGKVTIVDDAMESLEDPNTEWEAGGFVQTGG